MRDDFRRVLFSGVAMVGLAAVPCLAQAATLKPYLAGLISMGDEHCIEQASNGCQPDNSMSDAFGEPGVVRGYVINVTWAQLQPTSSASFNPAPIDQALATMQTYNAEHPAMPMRALLRVAAGSVAPTWAKQLAGGPVTIHERANGTTVTVGRFWTGTYQTAWRTLQGMLAARYDANPLIAEVSDTSCTHQSDEPYVNPTDSASIVNLFAAGYSNAAYQACLTGSIHDYDAWATTPVDFTTNPFENLSETTQNGQVKGVYGPLSLSISQGIMQQFRAALGGRAILANHNLTDPVLAADTGIYQTMAQLGKPVEFQTAAPGVPTSNSETTGKISTWSGMVSVGLKYGGSAIELWRSRTASNGTPIQDGWNPIKCATSVPTSECAGQNPANLQSWNQWLLAAAP